MYEAGRGIDRNDAEAYIWSSIAVANGDHLSARRRDRVASNMLSQDLRNAQIEAQERYREVQPR